VDDARLRTLLYHPTLLLLASLHVFLPGRLNTCPRVSVFLGVSVVIDGCNLKSFKVNTGATAGFVACLGARAEQLAAMSGSKFVQLAVKSSSYWERHGWQFAGSYPQPFQPLTASHSICLVFVLILPFNLTFTCTHHQILFG
jgi:hypothetical protein